MQAELGSEAGVMEPVDPEWVEDGGEAFVVAYRSPYTGKLFYEVADTLEGAKKLRDGLSDGLRARGGVRIGRCVEWLEE